VWAFLPAPLFSVELRQTIVKVALMAKSKKNTWVLWSKDEVKLLRKLFPRGRTREVADQTGRPLTAVRQKAYNMGLKTKKYRPWSANEVKLLKKLYPNENTRSIAGKLGRSLREIKTKVYTASFRKKRRPLPWSIQEETLLKKLHPDNAVQEIASQIGRSASAVANKKHKLGLRQVDSYCVWSKKELNLLKKLYPSRTAQDVAKQIGRTVYAVRLRLFRLGLNKRFRYEEGHRVVGGVKKKRCSRCKRWKAESEFYKRRKYKDGLDTWCKKCICEAARKYRERRTAVRN
jgi:hypothetical protein